VPNSKDFSHIKPALAHGDNVVLQHTLRGGPAQATMRAEAPGDNIQQAGLWSTAPHKDPKATAKTSNQPCKGKGGQCRAYAIRELGYCVFHARQFGLYDAWAAKEESSTSKD
jgi:hypothetical protein